MHEGEALLVTGGFIECQLPWVLTIMAGYCKARSIGTIVLDGGISDSLLLQLSALPSLSDLNIVTVSSLPGYYQNSLTKRIRFRARIESIKYLWRVSRRNLLSAASREEGQLLHAIWDTAVVSAPDGRVSPSMRSKWSAAKLCLMAFYKGRFLDRYNFAAVIFGHNVYYARAMKAAMERNNKIEIFGHLAYCIFKLSRDAESGWQIHPRSDWDYLLSQQTHETINNFKKTRMQGKSSYYDANFAASIVNVQQTRIVKNQIFLHVFKDSPFAFIDESRIFADYIEWIIETFRIIKRSGEEWQVRIHPSSARWGEDQHKWLHEICQHLGWSDGFPSHITVVDKTISNLDALANSRRVVTYCGTTALEACCHGIKPVTISETSIASFDPAYVCKPSSLNEYENLLLCSSDHPQFRLDEISREQSLRVLYAVEEQISLVRYVKDPKLFRGDGIKERQRVLAGNLEKLREDALFLPLQSTGFALNHGPLPFTTSHEFEEGR